MSYARCFEVDNEKMLERMEQRRVYVPYTYYSYSENKVESQKVLEKKGKNVDGSVK